MFLMINIPKKNVLASINIANTFVFALFSRLMRTKIIDINVLRRSKRQITRHIYL